MKSKSGSMAPKMMHKGKDARPSGKQTHGPMKPMKPMKTAKGHGYK